MTTTPLPPSEGWELDYDKLVADAFANHKYRQGTRECVAFKNGAHWAMHNYATQACADLEAEVARLRDHLTKQNAELDELIPMVEKLEAENEDLKRKLEEARALLQGIVETAADMARAALKETP